MRILVLPSWFPSPQAPLSGIFFAEQTELLAKHAPSAEVHVFAVPRRTLEIPFKRPLAAARVLGRWVGASKHHVVRDSGNYVVHAFESLTWSERVAHGGLVYEARRMLQVAREIERTRGRFDVVHAHVTHPAGFVAEQLARWLDVPLVVSEHMSPFPFDDMYGGDGRPRPDVMSAIEAATRVTAVSRAHARSIEQFTDRTIEVMPNFIDETRFAPGTRERSSPVELLSVGHLCHQKGFDILLRALRLCLDDGLALRLSIVGKGHLRDELEMLASELRLGDHVAWLGAPDRSTMPDVYRSADVFVLASRHESFGVVVIEALASGVPVVATQCGGPEEIVTPSCGALAPIEDPAALAAAISRVVRGRFERSAIRAHFEANYSASAVVPRLAELYREAIAQYDATRSASRRSA
jgi:glycosyltransferase involved in cell wall biosynthesis